MTVANADQDRRLVSGLLDRFASVGRPTLLAAERDAVVEVLTRVMTDTEAFEAYHALLETEIANRPEAVQDQLLDYAPPDIPQNQIVADGFAGLAEDVLADLVISPEALKAVQDVLYDDPDAPTPGPWFFANTLTAATRANAGAGPPGAVPATGTLKPRRLNPWALAVAASVLLAIGLGLGWLVRGSDDALHAKVGPMQKGTAHGDEPPLVIPVENTGNRPLFVCLVGLAADARPRFFYAPESEYLRLPPGSGAVEHFSTRLAGSTAYLLVLTETPAGDVVEKLVPAATRAADAVVARDRLAAQLRDHGYRTARVDVVTPP